MPKLTLFYNSGSNDSITLKNYFDTINTSGVEVNGNEQLSTKGTFISYSLDLDINSFSEDYMQSHTLQLTAPTLIFESDQSTSHLTGEMSGSSIVSGSADPKGGQRVEFTNLDELAVGDVLYNLITEYNL